MVSMLFREYLEGKKIVILGFGREGQSTYRHIRRWLPDMPLIICDKNPEVEKPALPGDDPALIRWWLGSDYLWGLIDADVIIKTPGIPFHQMVDCVPKGAVVTSQTELFLRFFKRQVIGITGTKGKSTTASLLKHMFDVAGIPSLLAGNIGAPCFDYIEKMDGDTIMVFEMSSHQLEQISHSPHIAVLLNIFEEHLDHYDSYSDYQQAKMNIVRWQEAGDHCIYNADNAIVSNLVGALDLPSHKVSLGMLDAGATGIYCDGEDMVYVDGRSEKLLSGLCTKRLLPGDHNLKNISAAAGAAVISGVSDNAIREAVASFRGLPHRLEYIGTFRGVHYYNDSISTIPEATMEAVKAFPSTTTLIVGGKDRGVDYTALMAFLAGSSLQTLILIGGAGRRMLQMRHDFPALKDKKLHWTDQFDGAVETAVRETPAGGICLLSPAAASYDMFSNFEERGQRFREMIQKYTTKA